MEDVLLNKCFSDLQFIVKTYIQSLGKVPTKEFIFNKMRS